MPETYAPFAAGTRSEQRADPFVAQLRKETAAVRLQYSKWGTRRALRPEQVDAASKVFGANRHFLSAGKKLIDTTHAAWVAAASAIGRARLYWRTMSVPFPVKGIRLIRKDQVPGFEQAMVKFREELFEGIERLQAAYSELREQARVSLGDLFCEGDYPATPDGMTGDFQLVWDYPPVEPPDYLKELNPTLWQQQKDLLEARFQEAAVMAETAFAAELQDLVAHLFERLTSDESSGKSKRLNKKAVQNFQEFFARFDGLRVGSNAELDRLVGQARAAVAGLNLDELRTSDSLQSTLRESMQALGQQLDTMLVDRPRRAIDLDE